MKCWVCGKSMTLVQSARKDVFSCVEDRIEIHQLKWHFSSIKRIGFATKPREIAENLPLHRFACKRCDKERIVMCLGDVISGPSCPNGHGTMHEIYSFQPHFPVKKCR